MILQKSLHNVAWRILKKLRKKNNQKKKKNTSTNAIFLMEIL